MGQAGPSVSAVRLDHVWTVGRYTERESGASRWLYTPPGLGCRKLQTQECDPGVTVAARVLGVAGWRLPSLCLVTHVSPLRHAGDLRVHTGRFDAHPAIVHPMVAGCTRGCRGCHVLQRVMWQVWSEASRAGEQDGCLRCCTTIKGHLSR